MLRHCPIESGEEQFAGMLAPVGHNYWAYLQPHEDLHEAVRLRLLSEMAVTALQLQRGLPQTADGQLWGLMHLRGELALERVAAEANNFLIFEFSSSSRLDHGGRGRLGILDCYNQPSVLHNDIFGDDFYYFPEYAWCLRGEQHGLILGVINLANYLDVNEIANCAYTQFIHSALVNNSALMLSDSNLGLLYQYKPDKRSYYNVAATFADVAPRHDPFTANGHTFSVQFEAARHLQLLGKHSSLRLQGGVLKLDEQVAGVLAASLVENINEQLGAFIRIGANSASTITAASPLAFNRHISAGVELKNPFSTGGADEQRLEQIWRCGSFLQRSLAAPDSPSCYNYGVESSYSWHFGDYVQLALLAQSVWCDSQLQARNSFVWGLQTTLVF